MRTKRLTLIAVTDGIENVKQETTCGALAGRVRARIARRPGRWRERMHQLPGTGADGPVYPEAA